MDPIDRQLLALLQHDGSLSARELGERVGLTPGPAWRRVQQLEQQGVIERRVALLDPRQVGIGLTALVHIRTNQHSAEWLAAFSDAIAERPEIVEALRTSGETDYLLRVVVPDIAAYDAFYKKLIAAAKLKDVSSTFAIEQIKYTTKLPVTAAD